VSKYAELVGRVNRAEQYFLDNANGEMGTEEAVLAEVCYRAAGAITELEARVAELGGSFSIEKELRDDAELEVKELNIKIAELEGKLKNVSTSAVKMLMPDCDKHTGINTPPFAEFMEKYSGRCAVCDAEVVDTVEAKIKYQDEVIEQRNAECSRNFKEITRLTAVIDRLGSPEPLHKSPQGMVENLPPLELKARIEYAKNSGND